MGANLSMKILKKNGATNLSGKLIWFDCACLAKAIDMLTLAPYMHE
jgi:hypothetical protein